MATSNDVLYIMFLQSLVEVSKKRLEEEGIADAHMPPPRGVFTRGML